ncbi:ABC-type transporter Mla subunit MlaD [Massilia sp. UYP11]|uniref:hypothetical protein n=1 Tax=Massilia sp. UYP11 TaxID=1756385 RepID=UPI003D194E48
MDTIDRKKRLEGLREEFMLNVLDDIDKVSQRVQELFDVLPGVTEGVNAQLRPLLDEIAVAIGTLSDEKDRTIQRAKQQVTQVADIRSDELRRLVFELSGKIAATVEEGAKNAVVPAINQILDKAASDLRAAANNLNTAAATIAQAHKDYEAEFKQGKAVIERMTGDGIEAIRKANAAKKKPLLPTVGIALGCLVIGAVLTIVLGRSLGVFLTKADLTELIENQRAIAAKLDGATGAKALRK